MTVKSDPLEVLLDVKTQLKLNVEDDLIKACYQLQNIHQYDKDRDTMKKMQKLIEAAISKEESGDA